MKNVYEVRYRALTISTFEKRGAWQAEESINVQANGSVEGAIRKAKPFLLKKRTPWRDDKNRPRVERVLSVKITSCERIMELDV
jgi:hypothetical protein